ncbi:MAG: UDP-N-acetylmuramate dehydrogenase [Rhodospirillaceae bacterium]|nr:UDP-N-acetylmuramate dehydrogenase [Rhodospirillaceae bacterium]MDE0617189.1 UDP-N-acetylmuramate dehydrogenase [Rhodospirillaceae bacterium]
MSAAGTRRNDLIGRLPPVRGHLAANAPLDSETWFRVGGVAEVLFRPVDRDDLVLMLRELPEGTPVTVVGLGSNLLVRDGGVRGVVIRMGREMAGIDVDADAVIAGAGAPDPAVAAAARDAGLAGLEFLSGIPGTIGGALRMNAGAYGGEMADILLSCEAVDPEGEVHWLSPDDMGFSYRHCSIPEDWIFIGAALRGTPGDPAAIAARMAEIRQNREASQPMRTRTGGSTFRNPNGRTAWQLVDEAGCRGLERGGAKVSEKHTNFLINTGEATAGDIEGLGEEIRARVKAGSGIDLQWEIRRIGEPLGGGEAPAGRPPGGRP